MKEIDAREANEVCSKGIITLPRYKGKLYGRIERVVPRSPRVIDGYLLLSGGRKIPWTPAHKIGW